MTIDDQTLSAALPVLTSEFAARAPDYDRDGSFPFENFRRLQEFGLLSLTVAKEFGGAEASLTTQRRVIEAVGKGDASTALVLTMQYGFQEMVAHQPGWPAHLREIISRDAVANGALINGLGVEPDLGTPTRGGNLATVGRQTAEGWSVTGRKLYATGFPGLTWLAVIARTDEAEPRRALFLIRRDSPGITVAERWNHLGMRATNSHEVVFDNVHVPEGNLVTVDSGSALNGFGRAMVLISSVYDGAAQAARDWLVDFLNRRKPSNLGAALATLPRFQEAVGKIEALLLTNRVLLDRAAAAFDQGEADAVAKSELTKNVVTNNAIEVVSKALELTGNHGLTKAQALERHYRDVLCSRVHSPHDDVILIAAGKRALSISEARVLAS